MAKQKKPAEQKSSGVSVVERLRLRVSAMINSPKAKTEHRATIWRLDSDSDQAWSQVMGELAETDGLEMTQNDDGTITLEWRHSDEEVEMPVDDVGYVDEMRVERIEGLAPF